MNHEIIMSLAKLTLKQALSRLENKEFSQSEVYKDINKELSFHNKKLNIYLTLNDQSEQEAEEKKTLALKGLPISVKDNFLTKNLRTTASSKLLDDFIPPIDATAVTNLEKSGGVIVGKTNLDAWAHGSSTETSDYGATLNPRNTDHLPGGSSGGSAAAVAADLCYGSLGTETAGSIRQPSSWCGVVGLKPTYGRVSRFGIVPMASSMDSPGVIAKTVEDAAILLNSIAGHDPRDATTSPKKVPDYTAAIGKPIKDLRIGYLYHDLEGAEIANEKIQEQLEVFSKLGAKVEKTSGLDPKLAISVYTIVQRGEVSSNLARFDGIRYGQDRSKFGDEAKKRVMLGTYVLSESSGADNYELAQKVRTLFIKDFQKLFQKFDILISPTSPGFAKKVGSSLGATMFGELEDILAEPSSIAGLPGISVPCYHDPKTNLYLGLNIVGPHWSEGKIITLADAFEKNTPWNSWRSA